MDLKGKAAIVTGSSSDGGIGAECAKILASRGCNVIVNYATNRDGADKVAADCAAAGRRSRCRAGRCREERRLPPPGRRRRSIVWGGSMCLINNAAVTKTIPHQRIDLLDADEFERIFSVNLIGNYQMCRAAAPHLKATGDAAIVNISSIGAMRGAGSSIAYSASKGALNTLTLSAWRGAGAGGSGQCAVPGRVAGNWTKKIMTEEAVRKASFVRPTPSFRSSAASGRSTWRAPRCSWSSMRSHDGGMPRMDPASISAPT